MKSPLPMAQEEKWYAKGLRFKCTGCGKCCTGSPGFVWVNDQEIASIAQFLKLSIREFTRKYLRLIDKRYCLTEKRKNFDCIFLEGKKCTIYEHRPTQCKTFPWWLHNLSSEKAWQAAAKECEGINHPDAPLIDGGFIDEELYKQKNA